MINDYDDWLLPVWLKWLNDDWWLLPEWRLHFSDVIGMTDSVVLANGGNNIQVIFLFQKCSLRITDRRLELDRNLGCYSEFRNPFELRFDVERISPKHIFWISDLVSVEKNLSDRVQACRAFKKFVRTINCEM